MSEYEIKSLTSETWDAFVGPIQIGQFTRLQAQQWAVRIPGSPETVRKVFNVLSGALQPAVDAGRLPDASRRTPGEPRAVPQAAEADIDHETPPEPRRCRRGQVLPAHRCAEGLRASFHPDPGVPRHHARAAGRWASGTAAGLLRDAHQDLPAQPRFPQGLIRSRGDRGRTRRDHAPRAAPHGRQPRRLGPRSRQVGAADARPRVRSDDSRHVG